MDSLLGRKKNLYISAFTVNLAFSSCGCCLAWTSPTLPLLAAPESFLVVNDEQGSWVGSLICVGGIVGPLLAGRLLDLIGRKYNLILDIILLLMAWAVLMAASAVWMLYLGRFLTGVAVGLIFMVVPLYIAEIAEDDLRGALCSLNELFLAAGFVTAYAAGPYLSYHSLIFVCIIMPSCFLLIFFWMPESPHHLLAKGKRQEAIKTLRWLRGGIPEDNIEKELIEIQELLNSSSEQLSLLEISRSKGGSKALLITCSLIFFQQFTGINAIQFYTQQIFQKATEVIPPNISGILLGAVQAISSLFTPAIVKHLGLKVPLMISAIGTSISQALLGLFYYLDSSGQNISSITWLPVSSLVAFTFFFCFGFGPLPWAVMGEMFPPNMKAISSAAVTSFCFALMFFITKFFTNFSEFLGHQYAFWLFSITCFLGFISTYTFLPETKGMSLQDIQDLLNGLSNQGQSVENGYEFSVQTRLTSKENIENKNNINIGEKTSVLL